MDLLPIKFPLERDKIYQEAQAFGRLSPDDRFRAILDVIAVGAAIIDESPRKQAMLRSRQADEDDWKRIQKELCARHGV